MKVKFTEEQITFMRKIGVNVDFTNLSEEDSAEIEQRVAEKLEYSGFDENYEPTRVGIMCESILDRLG